MILLDRREAGRFRAAVRHCVAGQPRGLAPPVHLRQTKGVLTLSAFLDEVAIALRSPAPEGPPAHLAVPWAALNALEGNGGGVATLEEGEAGHLCCRWTERGEARELECPSAPQGPQQADWPVPRTMAAVDPALLAALHACGQAAGRSDNGRYALARLQLRCRTGDVVGTDGRQMLLWGGFAFPFADDALVPAVPVFGGASWPASRTSASDGPRSTSSSRRGRGRSGWPWTRRRASPTSRPSSPGRRGRRGW